MFKEQMTSSTNIQYLCYLFSCEHRNPILPSYHTHLKNLVEHLINNYPVYFIKYRPIDVDHVDHFKERRKFLEMMAELKYIHFIDYTLNVYNYSGKLSIIESQ